MSEAPRTKRAKPDVDLVKLADCLLANYKRVARRRRVGY